MKFATAFLALVLCVALLATESEAWRRRGWGGYGGSYYGLGGYGLGLGYGLYGGGLYGIGGYGYGLGYGGLYGYPIIGYSSYYAFGR